jgi:endonuclease/exonuclease/phosphatase (EEP) superfamily protein YafD
VLRIDHGFVQGMAVEDFRVLSVAGSDHSAIVMDLVL